MNPYAPLDRLSPGASQLVVLGVFGALAACWILGTAALAVLAFLQARSAARELDDTPGPGLRTLAGVVISDAEHNPPLRVTITQTGTERQARYGRYVRWAETERTVRQEAFLLQRGDGETVRVEPGEALHLVATLQPPTRGPYRVERTRVAAVGAGRQVWVRGMVERVAGLPAYRARSLDGAAWLLKPADTLPLLVSDEPPPQRFVRRAWYFAAWTLVLALGFGALHGAVFANWHALRLRGQVVQARIVGHDTVVRSTRRGPVTHYFVSADDACVARRRAPRRGELRHLGDRAAPTRTFSAPFTVDPHHPQRAQIGARTLGVDRAQALLSVLCAIILAAGQALGYRARRPWHERDRLVEDQPGTLGDG
jgi:hypothetical protein